MVFILLQVILVLIRRSCLYLSFSNWFLIKLTQTLPRFHSCFQIVDESMNFGNDDYFLNEIQMFKNDIGRSINRCYIVELSGICGILIINLIFSVKYVSFYCHEYLIKTYYSPTLVFNGVFLQFFHE